MSVSHVGIELLGQLKNGLKFIISVLSIHPVGLVVLWMSLGCPGAIKIFSASEIFLMKKWWILGLCRCIRGLNVGEYTLIWCILYVLRVLELFGAFQCIIRGTLQFQPVGAQFSAILRW